MSAISRRHQVTIPDHVLDEAGLRPGDEIGFANRGPGRIEIMRMADLVTELAGSLGDETYPDGYLRREREGWG